MNIAVLLTCHNRREKTEKCLQSLKEALETYNKEMKGIVRFEIFLTDDGCTDGTAEAARAMFLNEKEIHILQGDGNLYWAGGMRFCWKEAMKCHSEWDYYLLINDDTVMMPNLFEEIFSAQAYSQKQFGQEGIVSGITCATDNPTKLTYGGDVWVNRFLGTTRRLQPNGEPQVCDFTNANILLVPSKVVDRVGIFYYAYQHGKADYDYSHTARKAGFPVILTSNYCGYCDNDHIDKKDIARKVSSMALKERKKYFSNPIHSIKDYLLLVRRTAPLRYPMVWCGRMLNLYFPKLYYRLNGFR